MKKLNNTKKRELRNRKKLKSVSNNRYRISIFKSLKNISAQIIDDKEKKTLVSVSSIEKGIKANNKKKIASMKLKLSNSSIQMDNLEKVIRTLSAKAEEREVKILGMKSELSDMGVAFDELMAAYENNIEVIADKNETIENQDNLLHTAYYTFGSKKELISNNVITAEGGFIGIGKTKTLKDDFNKDYFTKVNTTELTEIPMGVNKVEIITIHPAGSYELVGEGKVEKIKILDGDKFWSVSKYLVVVTK